MVTFCEYRTPQKKERKEGQTKAFRKKKRAPPLLVVQKEQKQPRPHEIQKRKKKSGCVLPQKKATPRLDSVFKNSVTHSFFSREAYIKRFTLRAGLLDTTSKRVVVQ